MDIKFLYRKKILRTKKLYGDLNLYKGEPRHLKLSIQPQIVRTNHLILSEKIYFSFTKY